MNEQQDNPVREDGPAIESATPEFDRVMTSAVTAAANQPSMKEQQAQLAYQKQVRKNNKEVLLDREDALRYTEINTLSLELNLRAMKAFVEAENLLPEYTKALDAKNLRENPPDEKPNP